MFELILQFTNEQRSIIHLILHVLVPMLVALVFVPKAHWKGVWLVLVATMAVDIDHLLATPIYAPNRCSIFFHPLHQMLPISFYALMTVWPVVKRLLKGSIKPFDAWLGWVGVGLLIHMLLDGLDCVWMKVS
ncbi:MAG: hypothetical protein CL679_14640 [Bermanella sp.]|nr:hypothetical protein [Bermanella sp.]